MFFALGTAPPASDSSIFPRSMLEEEVGVLCLWRPSAPRREFKSVRCTWLCFDGKSRLRRGCKRSSSRYRGMGGKVYHVNYQGVEDGPKVCAVGEVGVVRLGRRGPLRRTR